MALLTGEEVIVFFFLFIFRFCGPLTTVKIYTERSYPRVKVNVITQTLIAGGDQTSGEKGKEVTKTKVIIKPDDSKLNTAKLIAGVRKYSELILLEVCRFFF
jgi:hypothetical protein